MSLKRGMVGQTGQGANKAKNKNDEDTPTFEDHLAGLNDEDWGDEDWGDDTPMEGEGPALQMTKASWQRPPPPPLDQAKDRLVFQQVELDHYIGQPVPGMPGASAGPVPVIRMFGVTNDGNSVCAHVHGFHPYIFVPVPMYFGEEHLPAFRRILNQVIVADIKNNVVDAVLSCGLVQKSTIFGFQLNKKRDFVKITLAVPNMVAAAKRLIEKGEVRMPAGMPPLTGIPCEANIWADFEDCFRADSKVVGCNWIELPPGVWKLRSATDCQTCAQVEVDVAWHKLISHAPEGEWSTVAPLRILPFDIKCKCGGAGGMPAMKVAKVEEKAPEAEDAKKMSNASAGEIPVWKRAKVDGHVSSIQDVPVKEMAQVVSSEPKEHQTNGSSVATPFKGRVGLTKNFKGKLHKA